MQGSRLGYIALNKGSDFNSAMDSLNYELFRGALIVTMVVLVLTYRRLTQYRITIALTLLASTLSLWLSRPPQSPSPSSMQFAEGNIVESYIVSEKYPDVVFRLADRDVLFRYSNWYPQYFAVEPRLRIGNVIGVEFTLDQSDSTQADIWSIRVRDSLLVTSEELLEARAHNARLGFWLSGVFFALAVVFLILEIIDRRKHRTRVPSHDTPTNTRTR